MKLLKPFLQYCRCRYQGLYSEVAAEAPAAPSEDNTNQLFVHLTAPKIVNPGTDFNERMKAGEFKRQEEDDMNYEEFVEKFGRERWSDEGFEALKASVEAWMPLWENKPKSDLLTLFFNAAAKMLRNSLDSDAALKTMADAIINVLPLSENIETQDIESLDLSVRAYNILKRANINTVGDITAHSQYWLSHNVRNLGLKSMEEIIEKLAQAGVFLEEFAEGEAAKEEAEKAEEDEDWDGDIESDESDLFDVSDENSAYNELLSMIGLTEAKALISQILDFHKMQKLLREKEIEQSRPSMHMVFTGNPGVGKTEVARLFCRIMKERGLLENGKFYEASRATLVGRYIGHTANIVKETFKKSKGSVL